MKKLVKIVLVLLVAAVAALPRIGFAARTMSVRAYRTKDVPRERVYIECGGAAEKAILEFRRQLIEAGGAAVNLFLPSLVVCEIPRGSALEGMIADAGFGYQMESSIGPVVSSELAHALKCYDLARALNHPDLPAPGESVFGDRVLVIPEEMRRRSAAPGGDVSEAAAPVRNIQQNSEFLVGDILVQTVFPESQGMASSEDWTTSELVDANSGAVSACLAFQERYGYAPMHFIFRPARRAATRFEPTDHNMDTDSQWIADVMKGLGVQEVRSAELAVHEYNNSGRARFGTDWVFTAFVANSRNAPNHLFNTNQYTAYAFLGGPYLVIPFPAGSNDPNDLGELLLYSQIFQHETVHIFWGLDEYVAAPSDCNSRSGYLNVPNKNKQSVAPDGRLFGCPDYVPCLMWGARGNEGRPLCNYTAGQTGVGDGNENGIVDVFDIPPTVEFENADAETVKTADVVVNMKAISVPVGNNNPFFSPAERIHYAAPLRDAAFSVNGVPGGLLRPLDGRWNETEEDLSLHLQGLSAGLTQVGIKVRNSFGRSSPEIVKKIYFIGVRYALFAFNVRRDGIEIKWSTIGESFGAKFDLYRIDGGDARGDTVLVSSDVPTAAEPGDLFQPYVVFDANVTAGREYHYFVRGSFSLAGDPEPRVFPSNTFDVRAMLPIRPGKIVSSVSPNPFGDATMLSIDIPPSFAKQPGDNGSPVFQGVRREVQTEVRVTVYDVLGRAVKELFRGAMFSRVETFRWDGTNARNQRVASGIYFIKAIAGPVTEVRKVVVVR